MSLLHNSNTDQYYWIILDNFDKLEKINKILGTQSSTKTVGPWIGPKYGFITPWCTNVISIFESIDINGIKRIEQLRLILDDDFDPLLEQIYNDISDLKLIGNSTGIGGSVYTVCDLNEFNRQHSLGFDRQDLNYLRSLGRRLNNIEMYDLAQSGSEHCRHTFFRGNLNGLGIQDLMGDHDSLMSLIKEPWRQNTRNSVVAFCDNSSCIEGTLVNNLVCNPLKRKYKTKFEVLCPTFTAETHNFPTGVCPFPGAATGTGGRIRDIQACGRFGHYLGGITGYCVSAIDSSDRGRKILIEASNGASDYGNKFGEPVIQGFCREYTETINDQVVSWDKPIMFSAGVGYTRKSQLHKQELDTHDLIVKIGGPAYPLGIGGGSASSQGHEELNEENTIRLNQAVQRGNPEMLQKMNRVLVSCSDYEALTDNIIIKSIHDQGAGGNGNVLKEIVGEHGGIIDLSAFTVGDQSMTDLELWISEYQESNALIISPKYREFLTMLADREKVNVDFVGTVSSNTGRIIAYKPTEYGYINQLVDLPSIDPPKKSYVIPNNVEYHPVSLTKSKDLEQIFKRVDVGSKRFLTNKVDRSVTGLVAQQQCIGPWLTPLSNVAIMALDYTNRPSGIVTSIGEQPLKGSNCGVSAVIEMLTNMVWAVISDLRDIKCSGNWMWPVKNKGGELHPEARQLIEQARKISDFMCKLGIAIDGGKDSLSMHSLRTDQNGVTKQIKCPNQVVISGYVQCPDVTQVVTPELKSGDSTLVYIPVNCDNIYDVFNILQNTWRRYYDQLHLFAGHDVSDGGLITCVCEMALSSSYGINITFDDLYNEDPGLMIAVPKEYLSEVLDVWSDLKYIILGHSVDSCSVQLNDQEYDLHQIRAWWERTSSNLELDQCLPELARQEYEYLCSVHNVPKYSVPDDFWNYDIHTDDSKKVAIIREEGSNGDREMAAAFYAIGFNVYDVCMTDISKGKVVLDYFDGLAFVSGFSYSDSLGAARGWELVISNKIFWQFDNFRKDPNKFILGVCNGCQLLVRLGWLKIPDLKLMANDSGRFESRQTTVKVNAKNNVFLQGFDGAVLPIHSAHAEGKFVGNIPEEQIVMQYCSPVSGEPTDKYPLCPNGSVNAVAAVSDPTGRILAMMPHPERCFRKWQFHWLDSDSRDSWPHSPWLRLFANTK